jgi:hypothetical protein
MERTDPSLVIQGWVGDKPYLMTVNIGAYINCGQAWHHNPIAQKTDEPMLHTAEGI